MESNGKFQEWWPPYSFGNVDNAIIQHGDFNYGSLLRYMMAYNSKGIRMKTL